MGTAYSLDQILENEVGWLFYDAALKGWKCIYRNLVGDSVLDIGCASGIAIGLIKLFNPRLRVEGFEGSNEAIEIWKERDLTVKMGDIYQLPYEDNAFDTVYSSHVLEHCKEPLKVVQESVRVATRRIIHVVPDGNVEDKNFGTPHLRVFNRKNFKELFSPIDGTRLREYASIQDPHMNSLIGVYDLEGR